MPKSKAFFDPVDMTVSFPEMEKKLLKHWYTQGIVKAYLQKNNKSENYFSFLDGPITANNPMGVHHAWGRTYKDLWQRYKNMQGYRQRFQNGFDCQGLWVEVEVEKELGFKSKKDIEDYGIAKFVAKCKERVYKYAKIQTDQSKRLGYFMDWDNSYYTLSDENNYMIWHFLKVAHENGWIYKGKDVVAWCPRCETAISQHEILTEDYKDVTHESVYVGLPILGTDDQYLLIWTTTPWTIPANTAVAIDASLEYALVEITKDKKYWIAKERVDNVFSDAKINKVVTGDKLVGLKYKSPYDHLPYVSKLTPRQRDLFHMVIATNNMIMPITTEEGTGLVHTSTSTGAEDHKLGKTLGLPVIPAINDKAEYLDGFAELTGKNAKDNPRLILDFLENQGWAYKVEKYKHRYPACWRCKHELVWKVTDEWYIAMDKASNLKLKTEDPKGEEEAEKPELDTRTLRQRMIDVAKKITWLPGFGLDRELDWLTNMSDWLISKKNRYWGLCLPIWECASCGHFEVIGSYDELKALAVDGWSKFEGKSPHKPQLDNVKIKCTKCGKEVKRIEPVGNPWLDAGIVSFSTIAEGNSGEPLYLTDRSKWENWFPADFITESFPGQFKNWFYSLIAMSTVLEVTNPVKTVLGFATMVDPQGRGFHKSLGNAIEFVEGADTAGADVIRWMCTKQNPSENLEFGYKLADEARRKVHLKLWNVYNFFITYANFDDWKPTKLQIAGLAPHSKQLSLLDRWMVARLYQTVTRVTKHFDEFDAYTASQEVEKFLDDVSNWYVRRCRDRVGVSAGSPEDSNAFYHTLYFVLVNFSKLLAPVTPFISDALYSNLTKEVSVHLADWPVVQKISKPELKLVEEMQQVRNLVELGHSVRKELGITLRQPLKSVSMYSKIKITKKELIDLMKAELNVKSVQFITTASAKLTYDTEITPELLEEAKTRELVRSIQEERKKLGVVLNQQIKVTSPWIPESEANRTYLVRKTLALTLLKGETFKVEK